MSGMMRQILIQFLVLCEFSTVYSTTVSTNNSLVCFGEQFDASCPAGSVIMIDNAVYLRNRMNRCTDPAETLPTGCSTDAKSYFEWKCAARRTCSMLLDTSFHKEHRSCLKATMGYLEVSYHCMTVYDAEAATCNNLPLNVSSLSGNLSSAVLAESNHGSQSCPWLIRLSSSQAIKLTLIDFGNLSRQQSESSSQSKCDIYARLWIGMEPNELLACSGNKRRHFIHSSSGKKDIRILMYNSNSSFLIEFEVRRTAVCSDYKPSSGYEQILGRTNDSVQVKCNIGSSSSDGDRTWWMRCSDGKWVVDGDPDERCVDAASVPNSSAKPQSDPSTHVVSSGLQGILIAMGSALTVAFLVIAGGIFCYLRRKSTFGTVISERAVDYDPYGPPYFHNTLPLEHYNRIATLNANGTVAHARSHGDLCFASTAQWPSPGGRSCGYSTTLDMRRLNMRPDPYGYAGYRQQPPLPAEPHPGGCCTTCPVHGGLDVNTGTYGRRHQVNHIYDLPESFDEPQSPSDVAPGGGYRADGNVTNERGQELGGIPMSPFYHELDPMSLPAASPTDPTMTPVTRI